MRFFFASIALALSALLIGSAVAQRTVWLGPDEVSQEIQLTTNNKFVVLDSSIFSLNPELGTVVISGTEQIFAAYGKSSDVTAWAAEDDYTFVRADQNSGNILKLEVKASLDTVFDPETGGFIEVPADKSEFIHPAMSDLWIEEYQSENELKFRFSTSGEVSLLLASDAENPAPQTILVSWPLDNSTPWAGPTLVAGGFFLLLGGYLLISALTKAKPARKSHKKPPKFKNNRPKKVKVVKQPQLTAAPKKGRRAAGRIAIAGLISVTMLTACSPDYWPTFDEVEPTVLKPEDNINAPQLIEKQVVSIPQAEKIISRIVEVVNLSDTTLDANLLETRAEGPALKARNVNYQIRRKSNSVAPLTALSAAPPQLIIPQATDNWPKWLFAVLPPTDEDASSQFLALHQETPRSNYKLWSIVSLNNPEATFPSVAASSLGVTIAQPDTILSQHTPTDVAAAYGELLLQGDTSENYGWFNLTGDSYEENFGKAYKDKKASEPTLIHAASIAFSNTPGAEITSFMTMDGGMISIMNIEEAERVSPKANGDKVKPQGQVATLLGKTESTRSVTARYQVQLMFYIPPAGAEAQIQLLGYSWSITGATEG